MRLLEHDDAGTIGFTKDLLEDDIPRYAILSHTWATDADEVKFGDVRDGSAADKPGYQKILFCMRQAQEDGLRYFWIDTCCIDKSNAVELSEAINSMFHWYSNAEKCYVYLSDVPRSLSEFHDLTVDSEWQQDFRASRWFSRGWTLQELLAPKSVDFFSKHGERLGDRGTLERQISDITRIPVRALRGCPLSTFTITERFSWQESRATTKEEDRFYSLLGIMNVSIAIIYGEGGEKARNRLEREIMYASRGNQPEDFTTTFSLGNVVPSDNFVARQKELEKMRRALASDGSRRSVVLYGLGGIGKTQLSIAYATRYRDNYSAVFWLNIKDEDSVKSSFVNVAKQILRDHPSTSKLSSIDLTGDVETVVGAVRAWLSLPNNTRWLLIFDNYDQPKLPGYTDSAAIDIRRYLPEAYQGSVIITTRSSEVSIGCCVPLKKLEELQDSLRILKDSSKREDLLEDPGARRLAQKLDGLPLALATAGAYLHQTPAVSCTDYLHYYEDSWAKLQQTSPRLMSYEDRTLFSTWQISLDQIERASPLSADLLRLWAYFDNQDLWFGLLCHRTTDDPEWAQRLTTDELDFHSHVRLLCNHGLVEKSASTEVELESNGYSMHTCVHLWTKSVLNAKWNPKLARLSLRCVASHVLHPSSPKWWATHRRLLNHAAICCRSLDSDSFLGDGLEWAFHNLGDLFSNQGKLDEAEKMYERALQGKEKVLGPDHTSTLDTVHNLGVLYRSQNKLEEAEKLYKRALQGCEKSLGSDHISTLQTINNLGALYHSQGKLDEAEKMYERALQGCEKALGPEHTSTLLTVNNLGILYKLQGKPDVAEKMFKQALQGKEKALGPDHILTLGTVQNLGLLYDSQSKLDEAEEMYKRALRGYEKAYGSGHLSLSKACSGLLSVYRKQALAHFAQSNGRRSRMVALLSTSPQDRCADMQRKFLELHTHSKDLLRDQLGAVGRILMWQGNTSHAVAAFQLYKMHGPGPMCDGCSKRLDANDTHFVCKSCEDTDLCEVCYQRCKVDIDQDGMGVFARCADHQFHSVPRAGHVGSNELTIDGLTASQWIDQLIHA